MIFNRSIRWRLQIWHGLVLVAVVTGFGITAHRLVSIQKLREVDQELQAHVAQLGISFPPAQSREGASKPPTRPGASTAEQIIATGAYFIVWNADGSEQARSPNAPANLKKAPASAGEFTRGDDRVVVHFTGAGRCFLAGRPVKAELEKLRQLAWYLAAAGGGVLAIGLIGGGWMTSRAIRPIAIIGETAEKIATGDLSQRIPPVSEDELGKLAAVLNSTFSRLDAAFTQQARFTADAAHELRTPVAAMLMHAQNGLASENLTDEQGEAFGACKRAAQRMKRLIDSLLELSRLDAGQEPMRHEPCDLADVAQDCLDLVQALAQARQIAIEAQLHSAPCLGDAERLGQVVINMLSNAIEHARDRIHITTRRENGHVTLTVSDNGPGIPAEHMPHVFERFYRVDSSRQSSQHNGLGLAISKAIVDAHAGTLSAGTVSSGGARFEICLPAGSARSDPAPN